MAASYDAEMANLRPGQYAGSRSAIDIPSYLSGFFDGEGCFCVSISPRPTLRVGWEVRPSVSVSQNEERSKVIRLTRTYFGCGSIRRDRSDRTVKWEVRSLDVLRSYVLPHFATWPMISDKQSDYLSLVTVCELMAERRHLDAKGLSEIVRIATQMNPSGIRRFDPDRILRELNEMKA